MARNAYYRTPHWRALREACFKRDGRRCVVPGCQTPTYRLTCDHIETRPRDADGPTWFDVLSNVRTLCDEHDRQAKELASGKRRRDGKMVVRGCDVAGQPLDPNHIWNQRR